MTYNIIVISNKLTSNNIISNKIVSFENIIYICIVNLCVMENKPFVFGVATSGNNFTDREKETSHLVMNFQHGVNTVLISPRRWGKTSLVNKVCKMVNSEEIKVVYMDIFSCRSEKDFYDVFTSAIIKQTSSQWDEWLDNAKQFLSRINPKISFGIDPMTDFSLSLEINSKNEEIVDILQLPESIAKKKNCRIVICIDEFQQIAEFNDSKTFQKKLRTVWQLQKNVSYCLFGSKKHLMNELFEKKSFPFYKFGDTINLQRIPTNYWIEYICGRFKDTGKSISPELAEMICEKVERHSSYVQQLAWLTWINTDKVATEQDFNTAYQDLLDQNTALFEKQTENLSSYQLNFLRALVDGVTELSSSEVIKKYNLGSSSNVVIIKKALTKKELIDTEKRKVLISDPVLKVWIKRELCKVH